MKKIIIIIFSIIAFVLGINELSAGIVDIDAGNIKDVSITNDSLISNDIAVTAKNFGGSILSTMKTILQGLLIIFIVYVGAKMIMSMGTNEEDLSSSKRQLYYACAGLLFVNIPDILIKVFVRNNNNVSLHGDVGGFEGNDTSLLVNTNFSKIIGENVLSFLEVALFASAVVMFILAGIKVVKSRGNQEDLTEGKNKFIYGTFALIFVGFMEVYRNIVFTSDIQTGRSLFQEIMNIASYFLAPVMFAFITWAGYLYITSGGDDGKKTKAKNMILYALLGSLIYLSSWSILAELNF